MHATLKVTKNFLSLFSRLPATGSFYDIKTVPSLQKEKNLPYSILEKSRKVNLYTSANIIPSPGYFVSD